MLTINRYFDDLDEQRTLVSLGTDGRRHTISISPSHNGGVYLEVQFLGRELLDDFIAQISAMRDALDSGQKKLPGKDGGQ